MRFCRDAVKALGSLKSPLMLRLGPQEGGEEQQRLHREPLNEPGPLDPSSSGCVKVFVVVGDAGKPAEVQQEESLQQNSTARAAALSALIEALQICAGRKGSPHQKLCWE